MYVYYRAAPLVGCVGGMALVLSSLAAVNGPDDVRGLVDAGHDERLDRLLLAERRPLQAA